MPINTYCMSLWKSTSRKSLLGVRSLTTGCKTEPGINTTGIRAVNKGTDYECNIEDYNVQSKTFIERL